MYGFAAEQALTNRICRCCSLRCAIGRSSSKARAAPFEELRQDGFLVFEHAGFVYANTYDLIDAAMAVSGAEAVPFCSFHQQCIFFARDGAGLMLYFGSARRGAGGVDIELDADVGSRVATTLGKHGFAVTWDGGGKTPLRVASP